MADHALSPDGTYQDPTPVLGGVVPEANQPEAPEGVNTATFPALIDLRRVLPAERFQRQADLAKIKDALPEALQEATTNGGTLDPASITSDDLDALATMFTRLQDTVLDAAQDRDAMTEWLIDQEDPMQGVMYGFTRVTETLGN